MYDNKKLIIQIAVHLNGIIEKAIRKIIKGI